MTVSFAISLNQGQNAFALIRKCWHDQVLPVLTERVEGNGRMGGVERERGGEQASSRCVEMAPLHVRTITQGLQLLTRLNSTNRIFHVFFIFFFIMFIASRG